MEDLDFEKLAASLAEDAYDEAVDSLFQGLCGAHPGAEALFYAGRIVGRLDILKQLSRILAQERSILEEAANPGKKREGPAGKDPGGRA